MEFKSERKSKMLKSGRSIAVVVLAVMSTFSTLVWALQHDMPKGMTHEQHLEQMKKEAWMKERGNAAMGFDQDKTTHHFWLTSHGGMIQVETNDAADTASRELIRSHLKTITDQF